MPPYSTTTKSEADGCRLGPFPGGRDVDRHCRRKSNFLSLRKDQYEGDVTVDYAFGGALKGFALRARAARVESSVSSDVLGGQDYRDYRLILGYDLPLAPFLRR